MSTQQAVLFDLSPSESSPQADTPGVQTPLCDGLTAFHAHMLSQNLSPHTVHAFDSDLRLLSGYLGAETPLGAIQTAHLERFLTYLRHERGVPCKLKSLERRLTAVKVLFAWFTQIGAVTSDPAAALVHHRATTPLARVLPEQEITQLFEAAERMRHAPQDPDARPYLLLSLLLATGMKKSECMSLALSDIHTTETGGPSVWVRYESVRQRFKERRLRLPADWSGALAEYLAQYQPQTTLFECTARNLEYVLDDLSKRAGLAPRSVSFEALRWTSAVRDWRSGMPEDDLRRKMGLSHISWAETGDKLRKLVAPAL